MPSTHTDGGNAYDDSASNNLHRCGDVLPGTPVREYAA